jgi:hypothetical protein
MTGYTPEQIKALDDLRKEIEAEDDARHPPEKESDNLDWLKHSD